MLRSVVTTGSYTIEKYSRFYPSPPVHTQSQDVGVVQPEWQHFSNPVITLKLDVKKSMENNYFESVRLRVLLIMAMDHDGVEREVTMEDLDLLSFSETASQIHTGQGPPLKAVYRGTVVGIRYQYPFSARATSPASYRRFQVNFASSSDATQFIDAIRPVCPCKEDGGPPVPSIPTNGPPVPPPSAPVRPLPGRSTLARYHTSAVQRPSMLPPSLGTVSALKNEIQGSSQELPPRVPRFPPHSSSDLSLAPSSDPAPPALPYPAPAPSLSYDRSSQPSSTPLVVPPDIHSSQFTAQSGGSASAAPSLPALSQPTSTAATLAPQPSPPTATATQRDDESEKRAREAFLESLREVPELYSLPRQELENLVSVVVREPGFPRLLEALNSMWSIRGFLAQ